jgi:hypothetical protein
MESQHLSLFPLISFLDGSNLLTDFAYIVAPPCNYKDSKESECSEEELVFADRPFRLFSSREKELVSLFRRTITDPCINN